MADAKFITSAATAAQFIKPDKPMIAIAGKSNSGKSTLINLLAGQKRLAKTSSEPGRTRLVNYFDFGSFILADLPGYGYAAVSKAEQEKWGKTLDAFFAQKEDIAHVLLLGDIRRDPSQDDMQMVTYLNYYILPFTVIATKSDKLSRMKQKERVRAVANAYGLGIDNVLSVSGLTGEGKDKLLAKISEVIKNAE
ncbi:MAG: YihA family ribosome biogenesis GTP-binding protein [Clostridia bacterium]|nr:YihA family ribosome biogenesis GTP-binding protein [Clostridia bacterium]